MVEQWLELTTHDQCGQNPTSIIAIKGCKSLVQSTYINFIMYISIIKTLGIGDSRQHMTSSKSSSMPRACVIHTQHNEIHCSLGDESHYLQCSAVLYCHTKPNKLNIYTSYKNKIAMQQLIIMYVHITTQQGIFRGPIFVANRRSVKI